MGHIEKGGRSYTKTILSLFLGSFVTFAILYSVQPLIPTFSKQFDVSAATASLSLSLSTGVLAVSMLVTSTFSDKVGRKPIMVASLLLSGILAVVTAFSPNFTFLLIVRALLGVVLAGFPSIAMTYIQEEFHPKNLGAVMGIYVSGTSIGGLSSRVVMGALTDWFSWQIALGVMAALCLLIAVWFWRSLPDSAHFQPQSVNLKQLLSAFGTNLKQPSLLCLFTLAFLLMGSFVSLYNYIGYPLMAPPYNLSQTLVGLIFLVYLVGTFSSSFMGRLADRSGNANMLFCSIVIMLAGGLLTLNGYLWIKLAGVALYTFGFFGAHSIASGWVVQKATKYKAQASSLYLLFYYAGSSLVGTSSGVFWTQFGWGGFIALISGLLAVSLVIAGVKGVSPPV
ncbi:MFS transporter [Bacillus fonticola]|uniref:MFS transporter n=1 Tax=Bacillus fonticola TaxID=2728853 RepID=UPI00147586CC|nr:MFS transporter [Bacillus fonticola]